MLTFLITNQTVLDTTHQAAQVIKMVSDTIVLKVDLLSNQIASNSGSKTIFYTAIATLIAAIFGGVITIWYKRHEIHKIKEDISTQNKNLELNIENLQLQKRSFEESVKTNQEQFNIEMGKLIETRKLYELNLHKNNFEQLEKVLEFASKDALNQEKANFVKEYIAALNSFYIDPPTWIENYDDFKEFIAGQTYIHLDKINEKFRNLLDQNPTVFVTLHEKIREISGYATTLKRTINEIEDLADPDEHVDYTQEYEDELFKIYEDLYKIIAKLQVDYKDLEKMKKKFIKSLTQSE